MHKSSFFGISQLLDQGEVLPLVNKDVEAYRQGLNRAPYFGAVGGAGIGALGGAGIGALVQALRGKSLLKGLGYGALLGGLGGAGLGAYSGYKGKQIGLSPEALQEIANQSRQKHLKEKGLGSPLLDVQVVKNSTAGSPKLAALAQFAADASGEWVALPESISQYESDAKSLPYGASMMHGGIGALGGAGIGALVQALRGKSLLKGLGYGALLGGLGGAGLGAYKGIKTRDALLNPNRLNSLKQILERSRELHNTIDRLKAEVSRPATSAIDAYEAKVLQDGIRSGFIDPKRDWRTLRIDPPEDPQNGIRY